MDRPRRAALHNLGCKVNAYETEAMQQLLEQAGYEIVPFEEEADVYVINTCTVTNIADRKSRQMLHRARKRNPGAAIVAAGCYVQTARDQTDLPVDADIIIGNNRKKDLVALLDAFFEKPGAPVESVVDIGHTHEYEQLHIKTTQEHTRAFLKVQDGCNQFCSYCLIPFARGRARSRQAGDVIREVEELTSAGIQEFVLTGIHLSSYGSDFTNLRDADHTDILKDPFQAQNLLDLIRQVSEVPGVKRIRLGSLEPRIITESFARGLAQIPQICPHFHLSLQSGCDSVLKRMNRKYTSDQFLEAVDLLREVFDQPALTTDVIVGFPQETQEEFDQTVRFLEKIRFYETHIFKYSRRAGTAADRMSGQVPEPVKTQRSNELIALGKENSRAFERAWLGKNSSVLFEEKQVINGRELFVGYTKEYIRAAIAAEGDLTNQIMDGVLKEENEGLYILHPCM